MSYFISSHLYISFINHRIAFSCHSDLGCIANPLSLDRNFISENFDTRYLRSCIIANRCPFLTCFLSVLSEYPIILAILLMSIASGYIANLFSSIFANLFLSFRLRNANTLIPSPEASSVSGDSLLREENCPLVNSFLLSVILCFMYPLKSSSLT